jgi:hypothetical protein
MCKYLYAVPVGIAAIILAGCQKDVASPTKEPVVKSPLAESSQGSPRLSYGDTIFYLKNQPGNYTILPTSKPTATGYFKAAPWGLALDSATGLINVTQSETGLRYKVFYLSPTGQRLDSVKIVISGVDYKDAIYEIASTPNAYDTAFPIYNARPEISLPCSEDDDDEEYSCTFDETDLNGDGNDDIAGVIQDKLLINKKIGTIDLEASYHAGVFGPSPVNGTSKDFLFYYRLNDASSRALNKITVRLYYFNSRSAIPQALLDTINYRAELAAFVNKRNAGSGVVTPGRPMSERGVAMIGRLSISEMLEGSKRPPIIVIVAQ